jgi:hypothetical protein
MRLKLVTALVSAALLFGGLAHAVSTTIVISEFRTRGPNGANDEFIELYNKSSATVVVTGWKIVVSDSSGTTTVLRQLATVSIPPNQFYLLANNGVQGYSGTVAPNATYTIAIPDDGGIALEQPSGAIVDQVGMSAGSAFKEGTPLAPMSNSSNQSYERNDGGCSPDVDTDDNSSDFRFNDTRSFPQNLATICSPCQGVQCIAPPNTQCWISPGTCNQGACIYAKRATGFPCSDGDACTSGDACASDGSCVSGPPNPCSTPPAPFCSDPQTSVAYSSPGSCSSTTGCSYTQTPTACAFGCNGTTGLCLPDPCTNVSCNTPPPGGCYDPVGSCVSGTCNYTTRPSGAPCNDGNACTAGDQCDTNGTCSPGAPAAVDDNNPCTTDSCAPGTGAVTHVAVNDGTNCDDGNACNGISTCQAGQCAAGTPVTCTAPPGGGCYESTGVCNPVSGACSYAFSTQGTLCDDTDACTTNDQCDGNGVCSGSTVVCLPPTPACVGSVSRTLSAGTCSAASGTCTFVTTDTPCPAGCDSASGLCSADPCIGVACNDPPTSCNVDPGVCAAGSCAYTLKPSGAGCDDGDPCTSVDTCSAGGACAGTPLLCNAPPLPFCSDPGTSRQFDVNGTCSNGSCSYPTNDTVCSLGCDSATGLCRGDPCATAVCDQPPSQCRQAQGSCSEGICSYPLKPGGSDCDDGNLCTQSDSCSTAGLCSGAAVVCNSPPASTCVDASTSRAYGAVGACSTVTGECTYSFTDAACQSGCDAGSGLCIGDPCIGKTCTTPPGACFFSVGSCSAGACVYTPRPSAERCDDGNPCTDGDVCNGSGVCAGTPVVRCGDAGVDGGEAGVDGSAGGAGGEAGIDGGTGARAGADSGTGGGKAGTDSAAGGTAGAGGGVSGAGGTAGSGTGGRSESGGAAGTASNEVLGAKVEGGGCDCSLSRTNRGSEGALALLVGSLFFVRRRRTRAPSAR